jgi:type IV fimbrial biogenesis protein FimT
MAAAFTLLELIVAMAIGGTLLAFALPAYHGWIADEQLANQTRLLAGSLALARSEAIKRGHRVNACKSADGLQCADHGGWDQGFLLHVDEDASGEVDGTDQVLRYAPAAPGIQVAANHPVASYVSFTSLGQARTLGGGLQMGTFTLCKSGRRAMEVVLVATGRVRIARTAAICP